MKAQDIAFVLVVACLAAGCVAGIVHVLSVLALHVPFDPNEGWNAYFAQAAISHGTPYPAAGSLLVNNYPPLSFYVVGALGHLVGDDIIAGRAIAFAAFAVVAAGIAAIALRMGCSQAEAAFAAMLFAACLLLTSDYVGMDDPQLLGHAIAMGGLFLAVDETRTPRAMVFAALMLAVAFFVKHNLVLMPVALAAWLVLVDRRNAITFIVSGIIFLLIGLGLFREAFGTSLFQQIASARVYAFDNIAAVALPWLGWAAIPICGVALLFIAGRREPYPVFVAIYAAVATLGGLIFLGGAGVDANALFDADIALALCGGLLVNRLDGRVWPAAIAAAYVLPLAFLLRNIDGEWAGADYWLHPMADDRETAAAEIVLLRQAGEPVACEMLSLCYWAGKAPQVDVFNLDQRLRTGAENEEGFIRQIRAHHFRIIQLESLSPFPLPPHVEAAIMRSYRVVRSDDDRVFLAPR